MIGYLMFDSNLIDVQKAEEVIGRLKTFSMLKKEAIQNTNIYFFQNKQKNNYLLENEEVLLCATGTFIYKNFIGNSALQSVLKKIQEGENLRDFYTDCKGHFTLLYLNRNSQEISLFTDKISSQNSFYYSENGKKAFSSNLLLLASLIETSLDELAVWEYIHINITMQGKTIFKNLRKCEPGTVFIKKNDKWDNKRLWEIQVKYPYLTDSDSEIIEKTSFMFMNDLNVLSNINGEKIITDLSGGTDTRTILSFLLKFHENITVSTAGPSDHLDVIISKKIANKLGLKFYWYSDKDIEMDLGSEKLYEAIEIANGCINPLTLLKSLPYIKEKAKRFDVILGGNGGPLFKDHFWLFEFNLINRLREPNWGRIANMALNDYPVQDELFSNPAGKIYPYLANMFLEHSSRIKGTNNQKLDYIYFDLKCPVFMAPQFSLTNQFLDIYHPMLNGDIVEYMVNIKPDIRKRNVLQFSMIYNNNKRLAWVKTDNLYPAVPSKGRFGFLYIFRFWRYFRAFLRKFYMIVLEKNFVKQIHSMSDIVYQLTKFGYFERLKYDNLKIARILSEKEFIRILENPGVSSNLTYILNILSVELFSDYVEELGNKKIIL